MLRYVFRRLLLALPTLLIISMVTFGINRCSPYDQVEQSFPGDDRVLADHPERVIAIYRDRAQTLRLDRPPFYFSFGSALYPDTLYRVFPPERREWLCALAAECGDWSAVARFEMALWRALAKLRPIPVGTPAHREALSAISRVQTSPSLDELNRAMPELRRAAGSLRATYPAWAASVDTLEWHVAALQAEPGSSARLRPVVYWYGLDNQYHRWLSGFLRGDLGVSTQALRPVWAELRPVLASTLVLNGTALLLAYLLAVPLGVALARRAGRRSDRWAQGVLLFLYAMPVFWLGGLLILTFASPVIFGKSLIPGLDLIPWRSSGRSLLGWVGANAVKFILPVATLSVHAVATLALQMRSGMLEALGQDYIRTARAKGLGARAIYWRHAFRNALFPIITSFAAVFPAVLGGSLLVEIMFNFPGMGTKTQSAFKANDAPMLLAILMMSAVLTVLSALIADILYARADPRVKFRR